MRQRTVATLALAACLLFGMHQLAQAAGDAKNYAASECVATRGTPKLSSSRITNTSTTATMIIECPIVRDWPPNGQVSASAWVIDNSTVFDVGCQLYTKWNVSGSPTQYAMSSSGSTTGASPNATFITFANLASSAWSHHFIRCEIPTPDAGNMSYLVTYRAVETH